MKTRAQFVTYVENTLIRDDKETQIQEALVETIYDIASRHSFGDFQTISYVPCVEGQPDYPLPPSLIHLEHPVRILEGLSSNDEGWPLTKLQWKEYIRREGNPFRSDPQTGTPSMYAIKGGSIYLACIPDAQSWQLELNWGARPTVPSTDDADAHPFDIIYDETIKAGVLSRVHLGMDNEELGTKWGTIYEYGTPIYVGGSVVGYRGGVMNMIAADRSKQEAQGFVKPNAL